MKTLVLLLTLGSVSSYASVCNIEITGGLNSKNTNYAWNLLLNKGYYQLGQAERKIVFSTSKGQDESGNVERIVVAALADLQNNVLSDVIASGTDEWGILNPSWKSLIKTAVNQLPDCK